MGKTDLVYLRPEKTLMLGDDLFKPNVCYRHVQDGEKHIVYGNEIGELDFNNYFEYAYNRIVSYWISLGLIDNGKAVSKRRFKELADIHTYGKTKVLYIRGGENIYGFYSYDTTNADCLKNSYNMFLETYYGNMYYFDRNEIQYGNCGIPLSGFKLRVR